MNIIINADDFGYSADTVESTIKLFEANVISSATIMSSMPGTEYAIDYAKKNPKYSFGLHLNYITDDIEKPILKPSEIPSLTSKKGSFHTTKYLRKLALLNLINPIDIKLETIAQIEKLRNAGVDISHIDSHGHIHKLPIFAKTLASIKDKIGIKKMRYIQNIFFEKKYLNLNYLLSPILKKNIVNNFKTTDYFYMNTNYSDYKWPEKLYNLNLNGTIEIGVHPGSKEDWRIHEVETCKIFRDLIKSNNKYNLINWNNL